MYYKVKENDALRDSRVLEAAILFRKIRSNSQKSCMK
jgi:hypothetical protein